MNKLFLFIFAAGLALAARAQVVVPWRTLTNTPTTAAGYGVLNGAKLDTLGALTWAANTAPYYTGSGTASTYSLTSFARGVLSSADAATWRTATGSAPLSSPGFTGTPTTPTPAVDTNTTQLASTAFVLGQASASGDGNPTMAGTAARGTSTHYARADHTHPTDTTRAPVNSPNFTGTPTAPTPSSYTNTTQLATTAFAEAEIANVHGALAPRGGVAFDGTPGANLYSALTNQNLGTDPFSLNIVIRVPTSVVTAAYLAGLSSSSLNLAQGNCFKLDIEGQNGGALRCQITNATGNDYLIADYNNVITNYGGKTVNLTFVRDTSGVLKVYINGVLQTANATSSGGTPPTWQGSITSTYLVIGRFDGTNYPWNSSIFSIALYNLALKQSDVQEIFERNGAVPERFKWGTEAATQSNTFNSESSGWSSDGSGATITNNVGYVTVATLNADQGLGRVAKSWSGVITKPQAFLAKFSYRKTGGSGNIAFGVYSNTGANLLESSTDSGVWSETADTTGNWVNRSVVVYITPGISSNASFRKWAFWGSAATYDLQNWSVEPAGAIVYFPLDEGYGFELKDQSTNRLHALASTSGISNIIVQNRSHHFRGVTSTNGNQQLLGGALIPANSQILKIRARAESNTPAITLGTSSGGTDLAASITLSTTWKDVPIALTGGILSSNASVWVGSNSTDLVDIDISAESLSP